MANPYDTPNPYDSAPSAPINYNLPQPQIVKPAVVAKTPFSATPAGITLNTIAGVANPQNQVKGVSDFATNLFHGFTQFAGSMGLSLKDIYSGGTPGGTADFGAGADALNPKLGKATRAFFGDEPVSDVATRLKDAFNHPITQKIAQYLPSPIESALGVDKATKTKLNAVKLAILGVVGQDALNFAGGGEGAETEALAKTLAAEGDVGKVTKSLIEHGLSEKVSSAIAPHIAETSNPADVKHLLNIATGLHGSEASAADFMQQSSKESGSLLSQTNLESTAKQVASSDPRQAQLATLEQAMREAFQKTNDAVSKLPNQGLGTPERAKAIQEFRDTYEKPYVDLQKQIQSDATETASKQLTDIVNAANKKADENTVGGQLQAIHGAKSLPPEEAAMERRAFDQIGSEGEKTMVQKYIARNGNVVNTDEARELFPEYVADRTQSSAVHEPSSYIKGQVYDALLHENKGKANNTVLFTAGGTGAGKSTSFRRLGIAKDDFSIVVDGNLNDTKSAVKNLDKALNAGYRVDITYTHNDIQHSLNNAMDRAERMAAEKGTGRTLPVETHVETHTGAQQTFPELYEKYKDDPRVSFKLTDNSSPHGPVHHEQQAVDFLKKNSYNGDHGALAEELRNHIQRRREAGNVSEEVARGFSGVRSQPSALKENGGSALEGAQGNKPNVGGGEIQAGQHESQGVPRVPDPFGNVRVGEREVPAGETPSSHLKELFDGEDGKSWQSLVKGYIDKAEPNTKAHIVDYVATPEFVLEKVGLGRAADLLHDAQDQYINTLKSEFAKIETWRTRVKDDPNAASLLFRYLDGEAHTVVPDMTYEEQSVAEEMKQYLKSWAGRLKLPEDNQISHYITHIFERGVEGKDTFTDMDPELAAIMNKKVAGSVYDPFLQHRTGKPDYVQDVWRALDAYVKRGSRKEAMDPALEEMSKMAEKLDPYTYDYVKNLSHRINLRPTELEKGVDNFIKQTPIGYRFTERPTAFLSRKTRNLFYRGTIGLNFSSALRNLTQGANTYAKLGEKYTVIGYSKLFTKMASRDFAELYEHNILSDNLVQDRNFGVIKKTAQQVDKVLFSVFDFAEKVNRGSAYFGAKSKALAEGLSEEQAIKYAKRMVRETQFAFSSVDTPVFLNDDVVKTITQLQTYNVKQAEFLARMIGQKDYAGLVRWSAASIAMVYTIGRLFGMTPQQLIPTIGLGGAPLTSLAGSIPGLFSNNPQTQAAAENQLQRSIVTLFPAGAQVRKTMQGLHDYTQGGSFTPTGKERYPVPQDPATLLRVLLFGSNSLPQAQDYYNSLGKKKAPAAPATTTKTNPYD